MNRRRTVLKGFTVKENLVLSPIEKHVYYDKFPWRLIINLLLVLLVTVQLSFLFDVDAAYPREASKAFRSIFMEKKDDHDPFLIFNSPEKLQEHLKKVQENFKDLNDLIYQSVDVDAATFTISSHYKPNWMSFKNASIDISKGITEPFDLKNLTSLKHYLLKVDKFQLILSNLNIGKQNDLVNTCRSWRIIMNYDLQSFSQAVMTLQSESTLCGEFHYDYIIAGEKTSVGFSFVILFFSIFSFYLSIQKIKKMSNIFLQLREGYKDYKRSHLEKDKGVVTEQAQRLLEEGENENAEQGIKQYLHYESWEDIPISVKLKLFNPWFFVNIVGNAFQMVSSLIVIITFFAPIKTESFYVASISIGFSAFFTWFQLLQYLKFWKDVTLITTTIYEAAPHLKVFFGIFFPLFAGVGILAYTLFWKYDKFHSFGISMRTLYEMAGGDIVHETYLETWDEGMVSTIFLSVYMILFFTALVNILVAVIMEGYDRGVAKKNIDNNDPFPQKSNMMPKKKFSLALDEDEGDEPRERRNTGYQLKEKINAQLARTNTISVKQTINHLLNQNEKAKANISGLMRVKKNIKKGEFDEISRLFLQDLLANALHMVLEKISYFRLGLNKNPLKGDK